MLEKIIGFSISNKLIIILFTLTIVGFGLYAVFHIPVGTVPDITNNQVQVITTSGNLSTQEIEQFITAPVEMEMANLPGVEEIRSVSKFGISLVTVVFEENMGTYLPRQLIAEKIKAAAEKIPEAYGTPEMGPVSTGLGEIYQYILDVESGYEDKYTAMELRTIQDWIVKRRLSGIKGVVEVNSWGGYLKQYEVAIDPVKLRNLNISLIDVFEALKDNNSVSGGAYIEKNKQSYFIRGDGQIKSIEEIQNISIKTNDGTPVLISNVAEVRLGHANRFGAITANGKGETILGQVMMLKNANSKQVIEGVKERVSEIQESLPRGVSINPILERGELISKTSHTVAENLILGALIVFFTVLLLLGNIRSALVISSIIPLALFFTISMMYVFGIDANLMSLGALDFGIIIDGAVIIVEYILITLGVKSREIEASGGKEKRKIIDRIAGDGASKMMRSAIFGQLIILIVFIPVLTLRGVEGKMFLPMALAFSFAIVGAMIMGLTWLPVASSLFLKPVKPGRKNLSSWLLDRLYASYNPVIRWSIGHKRIVLGAALLSLLLTGYAFSRIGGEFVPTLDEGDFVIQPVLNTGTSLTETVNMTTRMEKILIREFPDEIDQIVCRIGAAEVPTDPMSMEEIDMIIRLFPGKQWTKAESKEELAIRFKEALEVIPGVEYEFTQPIEMRFNELITGVRADIAIKLYGENLEYIDRKAGEIRDLVSNVPGAGDVILEKTTGLPQIKVSYNRQKLAKYDMDVSSLNTYLTGAFGGAVAGVVFEGERRFDLVLRYQNANRRDIIDIQTLLVDTPFHGQIPLSEFANIEYSEGPAKISRDNTRRRVVVSVNVRNRDLQSVIKDIQSLIDEKIQLPAGYYIEYGGQFENLQNATRRLLFAVPVALVLIFIFLHFAFQSFRDALLIFTSIPLATVGGVFLLWIRGMPFSVSAGIGFIALFGIAVLNGIVLIEHFKELQQKGIHDMHELIIKGTKNRLRPVLLTAGAAAMGFLPMAVSTGAGAEVQRPLATVVIGGLITSTMLTMIALPLLFQIFYRKGGIRGSGSKGIASVIITGLLMFLPSLSASGQTPELSLEQMVEQGLQNNSRLKAYSLKAEQKRTLVKTALNVPKTTLYYGTDQNNVAENGYPLNVAGIEQELEFPGYYAAKKTLRKKELEIAEKELELEENKIVKAISQNYWQCLFTEKKIAVYRQLDSLYESLLNQFETRLELKDASRLEYLTIKSKRNEMENNLYNRRNEREVYYNRLKTLLDREADFRISHPEALYRDQPVVGDSAKLSVYYQLQTDLASSEIDLIRNENLPGVSMNYFIGSNPYANADYYHGFEVGLAIPLFYGSYRNSVRAAKISLESQKFLAQNHMAVVGERIFELKARLEKNSRLIEKYKSTELPLAEELRRTALRAYELREIDFLHLTNSLEAAIKIELSYFNVLLTYNENYAELKYFSY